MGRPRNNQQNANASSHFAPACSKPRNRQRMGLAGTALFALALLPWMTTVAADFPGFDALPEQTALPDPFTMMDGSKVRTPAEWHTKRRPELKALFEHYVYGEAPLAPGIEVTETAPATSILGGKGTLKQVTIAFTNLRGTSAPRINLALFLPAPAAGPVPVFLALNKCGNYTVLNELAIVHNPEAWCHDNCPESIEAGRGMKEDFWSISYLLERGYAFATYHESDIDPDKHDFSDGIHAAYGPVGQPDHTWGTIAAWSWGLRRCIDYLVTDPAIDGDKICVTGHSRRGKTALLTAAFDERVAVVVPHQSGTGGMALSRNNDEETTERINRVFPHWFCDAFTWFDLKEDKLPVDQHLLVSLVAPRALLDTAGLQDTWANYKSSLKTIQAADAVYRFLGAPGIGGEAVVLGPAALDPETTGNLMQFRLDTNHTLNQDYWKGMLDFADIQFGRD